LAQLLGTRDVDRLDAPDSLPAFVLALRSKRGTWAMAFNIEIAPRNDPSGATAYAVIVTIDDHETVLSFESKEAAESFAETERARLTDDAQKAKSAPPT
jgi:hypothetical protein